MTDTDIRSYSLKYPDWPGQSTPAFWLSLCPRHYAIRIQQGASVMDKRRHPGKTACADCDPKGSLRR